MLIAEPAIATLRGKPLLNQQSLTVTLEAIGTFFDGGTVSVEVDHDIFFLSIPLLYAHLGPICKPIHPFGVMSGGLVLMVISVA
jgi:hypothetical protein